MISQNHYELIRKKHGEYASWAVWAEVSDKPKSNMGDMAIFADNLVLPLLKTNVLMVGLNLSRFTISEPFRNFHDPSPKAQDYKIRFAFEDTEYYGAYMTDIIKGVVEVDSKNIPKHLKKNPGVLAESLEIFKQELRDLGAVSPLILAFGRMAYDILNENLSFTEYGKLIRLTHYSHQISKEKYRETVLNEIQQALCSS
ncbi:MAG: hypothetical protein F2923_00295 [Actinobacteria bacterium]|uniref:Unannotated protein n=1 Tax=freshwater metagenome TaxID=449393 RepID=A0A6J7RWY8_9ZZZZ|nr:hypothetical protein [Actinomycetota bacterium]